MNLKRFLTFKAIVEEGSFLKSVTEALLHAINRHLSNQAVGTRSVSAAVRKNRA